MMEILIALILEMMIALVPAMVIAMVLVPAMVIAMVLVMALALILGMNDWKETSQGKVKQTADAIQALQVSITMIPAAVLMLAILGLLLIYRPAAPLATQD